MKHKIGLLWLLAMLATALAAQGPALTTVSDTLYGASGTIMVASNETWTTADGFIVPKGYEVAATLQDGILSVALPPNLGSVPSGTSWTAYYNVTPGGQFSETWVIPESGTPVKLAAVRTLIPPVPSPFSLGLTMPSWLSVAGSPNSGNGTFAVTPATGQTPHQFLGTGSGTSFGPVALTAADLPGTITSSTTGNAATATALAAAPAQCAAGSYATGILASGNATGCTAEHLGTVTSVGLAVPSWLAVSGSPIASSGTLTVAAASAQSAHQVIGTGAGTSFGPVSLTAADLPGTITSSTSGNAATATALATAPTQCSSGQYATGIGTSGAANCAQVQYSQIGGTPSASFASVTSGTNTNALSVGTGGSLGVTGSGTIAATSVPASGITGSLSAGQIAAAGTLSNSTSGNAATATACATTTGCSPIGTVTSAAALSSGDAIVGAGGNAVADAGRPLGQMPNCASITAAWVPCYAQATGIDPSVLAANLIFTTPANGLLFYPTQLGVVFTSGTSISLSNFRPGWGTAANSYTDYLANNDEPPVGGSSPSAGQAIVYTPFVFVNGSTSKFEVGTPTPGSTGVYIDFSAATSGAVITAWIVGVYH